MRLENINRLDEALILNQQYLVIEGLLSDLIATGISKFQTYVAGHDEVVKQLGLLNYIKAAKELNTSLLDDSPESNNWWQSALNIINRKYGGKATKKECIDLVSKIKDKISPMINRDLENTEDRLASMYARRTGHDEASVDRLFEILFGKSKPKQRQRAKTRRNFAYESKTPRIYLETLGGTISTALDMLDPKKRIYKGVELIRSSNNARIAAIAISLLSQRLHVINVGRKLKTLNRPAKKRPSTPSTPLMRKYEMAMFINKCMADASKRINQGKSVAYWLSRIRNKAKRMGMRINMPNLPKKPYPKDFEEFKQKYDPNLQT